MPTVERQQVARIFCSSSDSGILSFFAMKEWDDVVKRTFGVAICAVGLLAPYMAPASEKSSRSPDEIRERTLLAAKKRSIAYLDARNGLLDMTFGDRIEKHQSKLVLVEDRGSIRQYKPRTSMVKLGDAGIDEIHYAFYKGRLFKIGVSTKGAADGVALLRLLRDNYGFEAAHMQENGRNERVWYGKIVWMEFDTYEDYDCFAEFTSAPLFLEASASASAAQDKAAGKVDL